MATRRDRRSPRLGAGAPARAPRAALLAALAVVALLAAACAASSSSGPTSDVAGTPAFADGESFTYAVLDDNHAVVGTDVFTTHVQGDTYVLEQRYTESNVPAGAQPTTDVVRVTVHRDTLRPISGTREIDRRTDQGRAQESYAWQYGTDDRGRATMTVTHRTAAKTEEHTLRLRAHYYDNESSLWLWRTLAFKTGYDEQYVSVNAIEGSQQTVDVRVPQRQSQAVPAGTFDTWRLLIRNGRAIRTAWINAAAPGQVVQWDNGTVLFQQQ